MVRKSLIPIMGIILMIMAIVIPTQSTYAITKEDLYNLGSNEEEEYESGDIMDIIIRYVLLDDTVHVADDADIFSESEIELLEEKAEELEEKLDVNFLIVTGEDISRNSFGISVEEAFKEIENVRYDGKEDYERGLSSKGYTVLVIDMFTRDFCIQSHCYATQSSYTKALNDACCDSIIEDMTSDLSAGNYYDAMEIFFEKSEKYMDKPDSYNPDAFVYQWWFSIGCALLGSSLIVAPFIFSSGGKITVDSQDFVCNAKRGIVDRHDIYLRTEVTRTRRSSSSGGGGGFGGGGGGSHGGGHGRF